MSYLEEHFGPVTRHDPHRDMPGVLDSSVEYNQLNTINFTNVDQRAAQVAIVNQGLDPSLAGQLMTAHQQAFG